MPSLVISNASCPAAAAVKNRAACSFVKTPYRCLRRGRNRREWAYRHKRAGLTRSRAG